MKPDPQYEVFKELVGVVHQNKKPLHVILRVDGHDIWYSLKEFKGDPLLETLQELTHQEK